MAAASKNDPHVVDQALERDDLLLEKQSIYPLLASWGPKSQSVGQILQAWNIAAEDVVFIDDSPLELAEVAAVHPRIECLRFPTGDDQAVYELLGDLRARFWKSSVTEEDTLRSESLRAGSTMQSEQASHSGSAETFLASLDAEITIASGKNPPDERTLQLINKTNQFNLNGRRLSDAD